MFLSWNFTLTNLFVWFSTLFSLFVWYRLSPLQLPFFHYMCSTIPPTYILLLLLRYWCFFFFLPTCTHFSTVFLRNFSKQVVVFIEVGELADHFKEHQLVGFCMHFYERHYLPLWNVCVHLPIGLVQYTFICLFSTHFHYRNSLFFHELCPTIFILSLKLKYHQPHTTVLEFNHQPHYISGIRKSFGIQSPTSEHFLHPKCYQPHNIFEIQKIYGIT